MSGPASPALATLAHKIEVFAGVLQTAQEQGLLIKGYNLINHNVKVKVTPGKKYIKVDVGGSGKYMIDAEGRIWGIKAYGVIHFGHQYGTLDTIQGWDWSGYVGIPTTPKEARHE